MLSKILAFTLAVEHLDRSITAWCECFGWQLAQRGRVADQAARGWGAPAVAGARCAVLVAPTREPAAIRLVEQPPPMGWRARQHLGWAAVEIGCADPYALADSLTRAAGAPPTPFRVAVAPRPIPWDTSIHAMQLIGPDGELLYLTQLPNDKPILDLVPARAPVDRPFIAVLACRDLSASLRFYSEHFGAPTLPPSSTVVQIVNIEFGLAPDARTPLGIVKLPREFLFEVDEYPAAASVRPCAPGQLPPGIAMLSVETTVGAGGKIVHGPDGEWLECLPPLGAGWLDALASATIADR